MPKEDVWHRLRGKKTYPRFMFHNIFEDPPEHFNLWDRKIIKHLPGGSKAWDGSFNANPTELSRYTVTFKTSKKYPEGRLYFEIGLYRDGFHIGIKTPYSTGIMSHNDRFKLSKHLFGDANRTDLWTQEIDRVPLIVNELFKRIDKYYENLG